MFEFPHCCVILSGCTVNSNDFHQEFASELLQNAHVVHVLLLQLYLELYP